MKKLLYITSSVFILIGCSKSNQGELTGVLGRPYWAGYHPQGTVYIPHGSFNMGQSDEDVPFAHSTLTKTVTVHAFYMDETEITNNEYRQFVFFVRDSIARRILAEEEPDKYLVKTYDDEGEEKDESQWNLNWASRVPYYVEAPNGKDQIFNPLLAEMLLPENERYYGRPDFDTREFIFEYYWIDRKEAARKGRPEIKTLSNAEYETDEEHRKKMKSPGDKMPFPREDTPAGRDLDLGYRNIKGQNNAIRSHSDRSRFIIYEKINVYPDTMVWMHDFTYSFNDPQSNMYFWHPAYDDYPVVGVTWNQAKAFCVWRTQLLNTFRNQIAGEPYIQDFRLPSEAEWEYAARGGLNLSPYPWGGPYTRTQQGCFLANFKPMRGRYVEDGGFYTVNAYSYAPNGYGLYNMAGNVAEWCNTAYDESVYEFGHDLNTEYEYDALDHDPISMKRKVIRGGSWKDIGYFIQTGTRTFEYQDSAKAYVGFRCVQTHMGRGGKDQNQEIVPVDVARR
jgi:sulfatase modifying factor 1